MSVDLHIKPLIMTNYNQAINEIILDSELISDYELENKLYCAGLRKKILESDTGIFILPVKYRQ
jgi:hypothetical protein